MFDDFLPHLIARLAYQLNNDLVEKLRLEGINVTEELITRGHDRIAHRQPQVAGHECGRAHD